MHNLRLEVSEKCVTASVNVYTVWRCDYFVLSSACTNSPCLTYNSFVLNKPLIFYHNAVRDRFYVINVIRLNVNICSKPTFAASSSNF